MKDLYNNKKMECDSVEELLIKQIFEGLSEDENSLLQNHLKTCKHCQKYQNQLAYIQTSMPISQQSQLKPDPAIRQSLMNRMIDLKSKKHRIVDPLWQRLLNILEYRIPVYQGLIGVACGLLIVILIRYFPFSSQPGLKRLPDQTQMADTTVYQINVIKNLQIIEQQKIGKNVREDSLLTRFIVTAM